MGQEALGADLIDRDELRKWNQLALATCGGGSRGLKTKNVSKLESLYLCLQSGAVRMGDFWKGIPVSTAGTFCFPIGAMGTSYSFMLSVSLSHWNVSSTGQGGLLALFTACGLAGCLGCGRDSVQVYRMGG